MEVLHQPWLYCISPKLLQHPCAPKRNSRIPVNCAFANHLTQVMRIACRASKWYNNPCIDNPFDTMLCSMQFCMHSAYRMVCFVNSTFLVVLCRLVPLSMLVSWEARAQMPTRQQSSVTLLVTHSRTLQAHHSTFLSSSWLSSLWCLPPSSRPTPGRASSSSISTLEFRLRHFVIATDAT